MSFHLLPLIKFLITAVMLFSAWYLYKNNWRKSSYAVAATTALLLVFVPMKLNVSGDTASMRQNESLEVFNRKRDVEQRVVVTEESFEERQARIKAELETSADEKAKDALDDAPIN